MKKIKSIVIHVMMFTLLLGNMGSVFASIGTLSDSSAAMRITLNDSETKGIIGGEDIFLKGVRIHVTESGGKYGTTAVTGADVKIEYINATAFSTASSGKTLFGNFFSGALGQRYTDGKIRVTVTHKGETQSQEKSLGGIRYLYFGFRF